MHTVPASIGLLADLLLGEKLRPSASLAENSLISRRCSQAGTACATKPTRNDGATGAFSGGGLEPGGEAGLATVGGVPMDQAALGCFIENRHHFRVQRLRLVFFATAECGQEGLLD